MEKKKIYMILLLMMVSFVVILFGVTYAWFSFQSKDTGDVTFEIKGLGITYVGEENVLNKSLYPTSSMTNTDNIIHTFSLVTTSSLNIYTKISLDIIKLDEGLKEESFVWKLYKGSSVVANGNFKNANVGDDILLLSDELISTTASNYTLYIWIDGANYDNPIDMLGKEFNFKLKFDATQEIEKEIETTSEECFTFDESTGTITDYVCSIKDVVIPNTINGVAVTTIGGAAFAEDSYVESVTIGSSVTTIEYWAFAYCPIVTVTIGKNVTTIEEGVFSGADIRTIYNNTGRAFDWDNIITGGSSNAFITGSTTNEFGGTVTITTN